MKSTKMSLKHVETQALHHRLEFLLEKFNKAYSENDQKFLRIIRSIYRSEIKRYAYKKLTPLVKEVVPGTLDKVVITDPADNTTKEITTSLEMQEILIERNKTHFNQSS